MASNIGMHLSELIKIAHSDPQYSGFENLTDLAKKVHRINREAGWWDDYDLFEKVCPEALPYFFATKLALIHSEASEILEGSRKGLPDDHLPHRSAEEVECLDLLIRLLDYMGAKGFDVSGTIVEKMAYNKVRSDHKREERQSEGGKAF